MEGFLTQAGTQPRATTSAQKPVYPLLTASSQSQAGPSRIKSPAATQSTQGRSSTNTGATTGKKRQFIDLSALCSDEDVSQGSSNDKRAAVSTPTPRLGTAKLGRDSKSGVEFFEPKIKSSKERPEASRAAASSSTTRPPSGSTIPSSRKLPGKSLLSRTSSQLSGSLQQPKYKKPSDVITVSSTNSSQESTPSIVYTQTKVKHRPAAFGSHIPSPVRNQDFPLPPLSQEPPKPKKGGFGAHARSITPSIGEKRKFGRTPSKEDVLNPTKRDKRDAEKDVLGGLSMRSSLSWKGKGKEVALGEFSQDTTAAILSPTKRTAGPRTTLSNAGPPSSTKLTRLPQSSSTESIEQAPFSTSTPGHRPLAPRSSDADTPSSSHSRSAASRAIPLASSSSGWTQSRDFASFFSPTKVRRPESVSSGNTSAALSRTHSRSSQTTPNSRSIASVSTEILVPASPPVKLKSTKKSHTDKISAESTSSSPARHLIIPAPKAKLSSASQRPSSKTRSILPSSSQVPKPARLPSATQPPKRKRADPADKPFAPTSSSQAPSNNTIGKRKGSDRAKRVDYTVPAIDAPDSAWVNRSTQLLSSTQRVTRSRSRALSSASADQPPAPSRRKMKDVEVMDILEEPVVSRLGLSTTSSLSSLSPAPTPRWPRVSATADARNSTSTGTTVLSPVKEGQKHDGALKEVEEAEEEEEEEEEDLLAEFADYQFAPRSPTVSTGRLSQAPITPSRQRFSQPELTAERKNNLLLTPTRAAFLRNSQNNTFNPPVAEADETRDKEEEPNPVYDIEAINKQKEEVEAAAKAQAEAERAERWARWEKEKVESDEEEEEEQVAPLLDALKTLPARDLRRSYRNRSQSSRSPTPARAPVVLAPSREDRRNNKIMEGMRKDHERDISFEEAYRQTASLSPRKAETEPFSYPTPTSRDPSAELNEAAINDLDEGLRGGAVQILKEAKAAEEATALAEARAEKPWVGVWTGVTARAPDVAGGREQILILDELSQGLRNGIMGYAMKRALKEDVQSLYTLLSSGFAAKLDKAATVEMAYLLLYTWFRTGNNDLMDCLVSLVEHAKHRPFSECFVGITCTLFSDLGMDESKHLPAFKPTEQAVPPTERDDTIGVFFALLKQLAQGAWLLNSNAVDLAPIVCLICADTSTSSGTRDMGYALLKEFWPMCLAEMTGVGLAQLIAEFTENLPMAAKRDVMWSIGLDSEESREITRWLAAELLDPGCLSSLEVDKVHLQPDIPTVKKGLFNVMDKLDEPKPDHVIIEYQIGFLYAMLDINGLVEELPLPAEGDHHDLHDVERLVKRAEGMIKRFPGASATEIRNKIQLSQLAIIIKLKVETAVKRRRRIEREKAVEKLKAKGLTEGTKGQLKLNFGGGNI